MQKQIYVIGHRNPDTDSVASAIAYAEFKRRFGFTNVSPAIAGTPNPQTRYILDRLQIPVPLRLSDVHPKVRDVLNRQPVTASPRTSLKSALELFHQHAIRVLPIADDARLPVGIVSLLRLSEKYLAASTQSRRDVETSVTLLSDCLEATLLAGDPDMTVTEYHLFIGAMTGASFAARISGYERRRLLVITGDRPSIQQEAIESRVGVLILTGGFVLSPELLARARQAGVTVLSTPHDTATAAWLVRLSSPLTAFIETRFEQIGVNEPLEHLRIKLLHAQEPAVIAIEEDGTIAGIATKSSLLAPIPYALILVDHNELGQAVYGAGSVEILEVIDHHKLGNAPTSQPITFMAVPVGSTCTIVATLYRERGIEPEGAIASLLLAGILSDTVILKSPTTTTRDREMALWLAAVANLDYLAFGRDIFSAGSGFSAYANKTEAIRADFKEFSAGEVRFGVGQVEVVGFAEFLEMKGELRAILQEIKEKDRLDLAGLMVTDIYSETTLFLAVGKNEIAHLFGYPQLEPHLYELKGVMSRKKQMIPHLLKIFGALQ